MSKRILVIEDQEDNRQILQDLLTSADFEVIEAVDGEAGVAAAAAQRPDLILMDIQLPLLDGYEATRRIKADPALSAIPIIVITSYALSGDDDKARAAGCDAYFSKPFSEHAPRTPATAANMERDLNFSRRDRDQPSLFAGGGERVGPPSDQICS